MSGGGAERVLATIANGLYEKGLGVSIALTIEESIAYSLNPGIQIIVNRQRNDSAGQIIFIRNLIKTYRQAVFISFMTYQNIYTLLANLFLNAKVIVSERNDPSKTTYNRKDMEFLRNILYPTATKIVFQTPDAMRYFSKKIQSKGCIICNPLRTDLPDVYEGEPEKRIVTIARINPQKNLLMMITGIRYVFEEMPDYQLEIYGNQEDNIDTYGELLKAIRENQLEEKVIFKGFVNDICSQIRKAALYVNTSNYEGISNAMLEAIAMGLPAVCTDCPVGGAKQFIKPTENGYLIPIGDVDLFSKSVIKALRDTGLKKRSKNVAVTIRNDLKVDNIINQWADIIIDRGVNN